MVERRPLVIGADGCPAELPAGDTLPGGSSLPYYEFSRNDDGLINNTTTLFTYLTLNATIPEAGTYEIGWYYEWSYNSGGNDMITQIDIDGTVIGNQRQEPKDVGGSGPVFDTTTGGTRNVGTDQVHPAAGMDIRAGLTAGAAVIRMRLAGSTVNDRAALHKGRLYIRRVI